ncbi:MAG: hypothetical protein K1060chlam5_00570 [Candidatus Anoxychlamydiales bacterium]|nr:hypothetical protein [Candidatus Anoxychlamydiales bacterium]
MKKNVNVFIFLIIFILSTSFNSTSKTLEKQIRSTKNIKKYKYKIIKKISHGKNRFTEGLVIDDNYLYESLGLIKKSKIIKINLQKNNIVKNFKLQKNIFGEGITILGNKLYQLTYISNKGFIYDKNTLELLDTFSINSQGWGLTNDGNNLIMGDGSSCITFLNTKDYKIEKQIFVSNGITNIGYINELEYVDNKIYANVWQTNYIVIIDPNSGMLVGYIDLSSLKIDDKNPESVLNGIAIDKKTNNLFITGKNWPFLYEIEIF